MLPASVNAESQRKPVATRSGKPTSKPSKADQDLIRKLLRDATGRQEGPVMLRVLDGMRASRVKLGISFDTGEETQQIQRGIVHDLEKTIAEAWKNQQSSPTTSKSRPSEDRRKRKSKQPKPGPDQKNPKQADAVDPRAQEQATHGTVTTSAAPAPGAIRELRRGWGRLPERDREEVVQGFEQEFLSRYREWIERYYRALADPKEE